MKGLNRFTKLMLVLPFAAVVGCSQATGNKEITSVNAYFEEITDKYDSSEENVVDKIIVPYKKRLTDTMGEVIGKCGIYMEAEKPESNLSNLLADVLRESADIVLGKPADIGIINMGGIRNSIPVGDITVGDAFEMLPFDNSLCVLTFTGENLKKLLKNLIEVNGEGFSGAKIVGDKKGNLIDAKVGGEDIDDAKVYTVATVNYLAEGNDKITTMLLADSKELPDNTEIRNLFIRYVMKMDASGKPITANVEGRIVIK
ncbi:MAG: 5'-nucleotidase [Bacteroides sp.]|nr:5'-nucleotidase [Bacteroides sp.]